MGAGLLVCFLLFFICLFFSLLSCFFFCLGASGLFLRLILLLETFGIISALGLTRRTFVQGGGGGALSQKKQSTSGRQPPLHWTLVHCGTDGKHRCRAGLGSALLRCAYLKEDIPGQRSSRALAGCPLPVRCSQVSSEPLLPAQTEPPEPTSRCTQHV